MANSLSKVAIDIVTQYKGAGEIKKVQTSISGLDSAVAKLGGIMAATFSIGAITAFGKASLSAFVKDQAAAASLAKTLDNLGQGFADRRVEAFIKNTETATGVLDEQLRPAMETLVRATGSASTAQNLLTLALDVSKGAHKDLASVASALGKAYLGQTTALSKLGVGLTSVQLKGKSFVDIQTQLNNLFGGQAATYADTYAGKIDKVGVAWDNVKEIIGKGMVDAFSSLSKDGSVDNFTTSMKDSAQYVADILSGIGQIGGALNNLNNGKSVNWFSDILALSPLKLLQKKGASKRIAAEDLSNSAASQISTRGAGRLAVQTALDRAAAEKKVTDAIKAKAMADAKANAALLKQKQDQLKIDQASALLKKAQSVFDLQAIEIAAALQNDKITADERLRLQMLQTTDQLAAAIQDKNIPAIDALSSKLKDLTTQFENLAKFDIGNPFEKALRAIELFNAQLSSAMSYAFQLSILTSGINVGSLYGLAQQTVTSDPALSASYDAAALAADAAANAAAIDALNTVLDPVNAAIDAATAAAQAATDAANAAIAGASTLHVSLDPGLLGTLQNGIVDNTASGTPSTYNRNQAVAW